MRGEEGAGGGLRPTGRILVSGGSGGPERLRTQPWTHSDPVSELELNVWRWLAEGLGNPAWVLGRDRRAHLITDLPHALHSSGQRWLSAFCIQNIKHFAEIIS